MAGSRVVVDVKGTGEISKRLNRLIRKVDNPAKVLAEIGEFLTENTQERFETMQAPDGTPWEELSETTLERKERTDRILTESGTLAATINYQIANNELAVGSPMEYAAMHQFGGVTASDSMMPDQEIPARPFLGIAPFERKGIMDILNDYLES